MSVDLVALALRVHQARSKAAKARALAALEDGVVKARALVFGPGRCSGCGYKRRERRGQLVT